MVIPTSQLLFITLYLLSIVHTGRCYPSSEDNVANDDIYNEDDSEEEDSYTGPPPHILTPPQKFKQKVGSTVYFPCDVINADSFAKTWKHDNKLLFVEVSEMTEDKRLKRLDNNTLVIRDVKSSDSGPYHCRIETAENPIKVTHTLEVTLPARITQHVPAEKTKNVMQSDSLTLSCQATGTPTPKVYWTRSDNKTFPNGDHRIYGDELSFSKVDRHYSGHYQCTAENEHGTDSVTFAIHVVYKPQISLAEETISTGVGLVEEIICTVHANPPVREVKWYHGGQPVNSKKFQMRTNGNKHILTVRVEDDSDFGSYACFADNGLGHAKKSAILSNAPTPPKVNIALSNNDVPELSWSSRSHLKIDQFEVKYQTEAGEKKVAITDIKEEGNVYSGQIRLHDAIEGLSNVTIRAHNQHNWSGHSAVPVTKTASSSASLVTRTWLPLLTTLFVILRFTH